MNRILFLWIFMLTIKLSAWANGEVTFTASATPDAVAVGEQFRLSYTITTQDIRDFRIPSIKGFDVLMGPSRSQQSSVQRINGKTTSTNSITFTYILLATSEGNFTIPGATITANGNQMISNAVNVKVLPADETSNQKKDTNKTTISSNDLFVTATVNKTHVYEQEAILLTYKIYTQVDLRAFDNIKLPDFKGFHSQEIELPNNRRWGLEHYKGRNYQTTIYRQFVLFPQQTGKLTIDAARFDASVAVVSNQSMDPFDAFFNGGGNIIEVKKSLFTPKQIIEVQPLPNKPTNFSGGVGEFNITSSINTSNVKTNEAITVKLVISGTGNLKLITDPEVKFPEDFEIYDPKSENNFRLTNAGLSGNRTIEYLAIPRNPGNYKIPAIEFTFFDTRSHSYKTLRTEDYQIQVEKGQGNVTQTVVNSFSNKEELKVLNEDIRFIKQNDVILIPRGQFFLGTFYYWLFYLIPLGIFVFLFIIYRKQIAANANVAKIRTRKANKVAVKRLKISGQFLSMNKKDEFYDEVLKALWGYVSDKLNIPISKKKKNNIEEELRNYGVNDELIKEFINVLDNCEFARFSPSETNSEMDKIYENALRIISNMENSIKQ